jgi:hypothetical protein
MLDQGTLPLNNFIALSWMLLIVSAVGTEIPIASGSLIQHDIFLEKILSHHI